MILRHDYLERIYSKLQIEHIRSKFFLFKNEVRYGIPDQLNRTITNMKKNKSLNNVIDSFYKKGDDCNYGCLTEDIEKMREIAVNKSNSTKNIYAVKFWTWFNIEIEGEKLEIVKADYVVYTNNRRFDIGDWVRTSPIISFTHNCLCETTNSFYILVGKGTRKKSESDHLSMFYFS